MMVVKLVVVVGAAEVGGFTGWFMATGLGRPLPSNLEGLSEGDLVLEELVWTVGL